VTGVHIEGRTREGGGTSPRWITAARPSSAGYTRELEPGHLGRAKPRAVKQLSQEASKSNNSSTKDPQEIKEDKEVQS